MALTFSPLLPWPLIAALGIAALVLALLGFWRGMRGSALRALALAALLGAIANPLLVDEQREPLSTVVPIVVDRSASQTATDRTARTDAALAGLIDRLKAFPRIETRIVEAKDDPDTDTPSTRLFSALSDAIADVPSARVGAAIFLTDGQIHDLPGPDANLGFNAPIHGLTRACATPTCT